MFTGIIESEGVVKRIESKGEGKTALIETDMDLSQSKTGDSIAVSGACFTVLNIKKNSFMVDMAPETVARTTFKNAAVGTKVNLERALRFSDRLDGHLVSGHIDGTGIIHAKNKKSNAWIITVQVSEKLSMEMIEKGSVAVDGISLTINRCSDSDFEVSIIPHTAKMTTIGLKNAGEEVNIETDMIGKYVKKFLERKAAATVNENGKTDISMTLLARKGYL